MRNLDNLGFKKLKQEDMDAIRGGWTIFWELPHSLWRSAMQLRDEDPQETMDKLVESQGIV